jgi:hypothetical protein
MLDILKTLLQSRSASEPHYLATTGWLSDTSPEKRDAHYAEYSSRHAAARDELERLLGPAERTLPRDEDWFAVWYPEAFAAAVWRCDGKYVCLAAEHHDKEAPISLALFCLTKAELTERAG